MKSVSYEALFSWVITASMGYKPIKINQLGDDP
jgi:hypothetical protein